MYLSTSSAVTCSSSCSGLVSSSSCVASKTYVSSSKSLAESYSPSSRMINTRLLGHSFMTWTNALQVWHWISFVLLEEVDDDDELFVGICVVLFSGAKVCDAEVDEEGPGRE